MGEEEKRLEEAERKQYHWRRWGPFLSERQWGTVREDYSATGDAWNYFPFDQAASRAYRWGEDGIGGISDNHQKVCFSFAFWNGKDPILKERLFGLTNEEGNHGEDVKECYYYLDNVPTHSYMRMLYKYPQAEFPYQRLREENRRRGAHDPEFELIDTGVFDENRYFDLFIEYAKADPEDLLIRLTVCNRGPDPAPIHLVPQLWLRNTWSWQKRARPGKIVPEEGALHLALDDFGDRFLYCEERSQSLFTENETNFQKVFGAPNPGPFVKDGFHEAIVRGRSEAVNATGGTKAALHVSWTLKPGQERQLCLRFKDRRDPTPFSSFASQFDQRKREMDAFYEAIAPREMSAERKNIQRAAFAGLLWSKQFYHYVVEEWLNGDDPTSPPPIQRKSGRNAHWKHLYNDDILSMPDVWEYPWFASWDAAFQMVPFALIDPWVAKRQLTLYTREWYMHPNGQIPAYEWNFSDVTPPVTAWAAWRVFKILQRKHGREDREFLEQIFQKLVMNFTWWVNRKDAEGRNVFEGGFLGLDNISIFNRSEQLPQGGKLTQSDATSWMGMYCLNLWTMAIELASREPIYEDMASKFFEHFLYIAEAINYAQPNFPSLWDEHDGFYYDVLQTKEGGCRSLKIRSAVGLIPLFAVATLEEELLESMAGFKKRFDWYVNHRRDLCLKVACLQSKGENNRRILSILDQEKLTRILEKLLDEEEFLSPYGIRSVSRYHKDHPFELRCSGSTYRIDYEPGESTTRLFGGNSNWRGPIWFPLNYLIIESLQKYHHYYGDRLTVECPARSGRRMNLRQVADELTRRLLSLFEAQSGRRPCFGAQEKFQSDPYFRDLSLFHEYYHAETGLGLGASHQTGWTALIAKLLQQCPTI